jgi:hypothetical protein
MHEPKDRNISIRGNAFDPAALDEVCSGERITFNAGSRRGEITQVRVLRDGQESRLLFGGERATFDVRRGEALTLTVQPHDDRADYEIEAPHETSVGEGGPQGPIKGSIKVVKTDS